MGKGNWKKKKKKKWGVSEPQRDERTRGRGIREHRDEREEDWKKKKKKKKQGVSQ